MVEFTSDEQAFRALKRLLKSGIIASFEVYTSPTGVNLEIYLLSRNSSQQAFLFQRPTVKYTFQYRSLKEAASSAFTEFHVDRECKVIDNVVKLYG